MDKAEQIKRSQILSRDLVVPIHYPDTPYLVYHGIPTSGHPTGKYRYHRRKWDMGYHVLLRREFGMSQMASVILSSRVTLQLCILRSSLRDEDDGRVDAPGPVTSMVASMICRFPRGPESMVSHSHRWGPAATCITSEG